MKKILILFFPVFSLLSASELKIYDDTEFVLLQKTSAQEEITACLNEVGVRFEQWGIDPFITLSSTEQEIQKAYQEDIDRLKQENGFQKVDLLSISLDHPKKEELRQKFLNEHTHNEPEIRFFIEGSGEFFLHIGRYVYAVFCEKGDLISVPENCPHWFDMGANPSFTAIRFFTKADGWIAYFTDNPIAQKFVN